MYRASAFAGTRGEAERARDFIFAAADAPALRELSALHARENKQDRTNPL
jgi:hypothetical protein